MEKNKYENLLYEIAACIVDFPEEIKIEKKIDDRGVLLTIRVAQSDVSSFLGREGATLNAIRRILKIAGFKEDARVAVKLIEY